jgi:uncharacterized protein YjdB
MNKKKTHARRWSSPASKGLSFLFCLVFFSLLFSTVAHAQDPPQYGTPFAGVPDPRDVNMYQAHIRPYSAAGNLAGVTARLDNIKALGTNVIYLMPIYPHGTDSRSSASPYCIKDFKSVATEYGSLTDLRTLVDGAHSRGMAVMLDIAINGTSWDHPWISQHPDWYVQSGGVIQQLASFSDIAALNFANTSMRAALVDAMRYWIFAANIDGYRCDFANNPPLDFWTNTISNLRGITTHKLLMFAEGDRLQNFQTGFDLNFGDKWFYDVLEDISKGSSVATTTQATTNTEYTYATGSQQVVRYTANHDTEADEGGANYPYLPFKLFKTHQGIVANFLVCAYMRGVPFLTSGQEVDFNQPIPWPYTSVKIDWNANTGAAADFAKVLNFRTGSAAIRRGTMTNYSDANVCAFTKINGTEKVVVMTNLRNAASNYVIPAALAGSYKDAYTGAAVTLTSGATQSLAAFQYIVLTNANVATVPVTGVTVSPTSASISAGLTRQLTATVAPANATNQSVTWTSSNTGVATVSASGLVTAVAAGTATITVKTVDGNKTATSTITVTAAPNFTVHFYRPSTWGTAIKVYWWSALPAGVLADGTWPGVSMTSEGNGYYSYTFYNITSTNLIFNDGTNQTANLTRNKTGWYLNGVWYDTNPGVPTGTVYYQIQNRWQPTTYLYDGGTGQVKYGSNPSSTNNAYQWTLVSAGSGFVQLKNRATGNYMHVENQNGSVQCGTVDLTWYSGMWTIAAATDGWSYIQNRWQPSEWVHIEGQVGYAQYSGAQAGWYSAMWKLVAPGTGTAAARVDDLQAALATDMVDAKKDNVTLYPNPSTGHEFFIQLNGLEPSELATVRISDNKGQVVLERKIGSSARIAHQLPAGLYLVQVSSKRIRVSKKLIIQ